VYAQVLKQLTENPSVESIRKGWKLLMILLERISPGSAFDLYIHMAVRRSSLSEGLKKRLQQALHATSYFKVEGEANLLASEVQGLEKTIGEEFNAFNTT